MAWIAAATPALTTIGTALTTAAPYVSAGTAVIAGRQASAAGKYNQAVQNRNAQVAQQEAERLEQQKEFDIARFDQQFTQLQGETKTAILTSGVELSGSGLNIMKYNAQQAEIEKIF